MPAKPAPKKPAPKKPAPKKPAPKPPVLAYDARVAASLRRLVRLGVVRLTSTPQGDAVTITRQGRVALTRANPAPGWRTADVRALQSLAARECAARRRVAIETREDVAVARRDRRAAVAAAKRDARARVADARAARDATTAAAPRGVKGAARRAGAATVAATRATARADVAARVADARASVVRALAARDAKRARADTACEVAREQSRSARGVRRARTSARELAAERAQRARADAEAAFGDVPGVMTVYDRTGGPVRWGGPRGWERFGEYLEQGGYDEASAAAADDAEAWVAREWAAHEAREREAYERDPAAYMAARANPRRPSRAEQAAIREAEEAGVYLGRDHRGRWYAVSEEDAAIPRAEHRTASQAWDAWCAARV